MALAHEYRDLEIKSNDRIRKSDINRLYRNLVQNDSSIFPGGKVPGIWTRRWFNNDSIAGYSKGDSVWINTENKMDFIFGRANEIYDYAINNPLLARQMTKLDIMDSKSIDLYLNIVDGFVDRTTGKQIPCLYWLGDISKPVQIRVCTADNTKETPDNDECWKDFYLPNDKNGELFTSKYKSMMDKAIEDHMLSYHPDDSFDDITNTYVFNNLSNIPVSSLQRYNKGILRKKSIKGFDFIKYSVVRHFPGGSTRWFRLWNSGYLEHGGTVITTAMTDAESLEYDDTCMRVMFAWKLEDGSFAPEYEFPGIGVDMFYEDAILIMKAGVPYSTSGNIGHSNRYSISVSPCIETEDMETNNIFSSFPNVSVNTLTNSSFSFSLVKGCSKYSFSVSGWTVSRVATTPTHSFPVIYSVIGDVEHSGTTVKLIICTWKDNETAASNVRSVEVSAMGSVDLYDYVENLGDDYVFLGWFVDGGSWTNPIPSSYDSETETRKCIYTPKHGTVLVHGRYCKLSDIDSAVFIGNETTVKLDSASITMSGEMSPGASAVFVSDGEDDSSASTT